MTVILNTDVDTDYESDVQLIIEEFKGESDE